MHELLFAKALIPETVVVCKLPLRPYSLGHELLLIRRNNLLLLFKEEDFVKAPLEDQVRAILSAADICSQTWSQLHYQPLTWRERFNLNRIWKKWDRALKSEKDDLTYYPSQITAFRAYVALGKSDFPGNIPDDADGETRFVGAPEALRLYQFVCDRIPASELALYGSSAWDYPYALARMQNSSWLETEGRWSIYNYKDQCHDDYVAQRESERAAAGNQEGITIHPPVAEEKPHGSSIVNPKS